jgi:O-acetyl-ADP-ribose deacetylase (regulator of RNase III)
MSVEVVEGDLLAQRVDAIVNAWNRNVIPRWLLVPQGVSKAIKIAAGPAPFRELARLGSIPLGSAVLTTAGRLPYRGIIHVTGINLRWRATEASIRASTRNAVTLARQQGYQSIAFPIIGAGSGGFPEDRALDIMRASVDAAPLAVRLVRYQPRKEAEQ